jgi:hypothetical protein
LVVLALKSRYDTEVKGTGAGIERWRPYASNAMVRVIQNGDNDMGRNGNQELQRELAINGKNCRPSAAGAKAEPNVRYG